jgi:hypothetical protein
VGGYATSLLQRAGSAIRVFVEKALQRAGQAIGYIRVAIASLPCEQVAQVRCSEPSFDRHVVFRQSMLKASASAA